MSYLSVSTWSLHRLLGPLRWTIWDAEQGVHKTIEEEQPQVHTLLELPAEAARRGYQAIEVCHFHFPSKEESYLAELRQAFGAAGISLDTLLLDYGDLTAADEFQRAADVGLIREWIRIASICGAKQIRVIAGEALPTDKEAISLSAASLSELAAYAETLGVRVITENFRPLTSTAASSLDLLGQLSKDCGFITDFGNFKGTSKYDDIQLTVPYSVSIHAKPNFDEEGFPDEGELVRCLEAVRVSGFQGAYVLIYDGPGDMWEGLERVGSIVKPFASGRIAG